MLSKNLWGELTKLISQMIQQDVEWITFHVRARGGQLDGAEYTITVERHTPMSSTQAYDGEDEEG